MSIDLRCYTKLTVPELQAKLDMFRARNPHVFPECYVLYKATPLGPFDKEISNEFGLDPESFFRIHINDKKFKISTEHMADMVRSELGNESVIVLLNGEELI